MRTALLVLLALAAPALSGTASAADVWKWVDEKGITHYSDQPVPGATKVEVRAGNVSQSRPASDSPSPSTPPSTAADRGAVYRTFEIWRPENDQVFVNTAGEVNVEIRIEPELQHAEHRFGQLAAAPFSDRADQFFEEERVARRAALGQRRVVAGPGLVDDGLGIEGVLHDVGGVFRTGLRHARRRASIILLNDGRQQ